MHELDSHFLSFNHLLNFFLFLKLLPLPPSTDLHASPPVAAAGAEEAKSQRAAAASTSERECQTQAVSMETSSQSCKKAAHTPPPPPVSLSSPVTEVAATDTGFAMSVAAAGGLEDDKDRIVVEIMQMYSRQQEKLNSTLHKQLQLEMVSWRSVKEQRLEMNEPPTETTTVLAY